MQTSCTSQSVFFYLSDKKQIVTWLLILPVFYRVSSSSCCCCFSRCRHFLFFFHASAPSCSFNRQHIFLPFYYITIATSFPLVTAIETELDFSLLLLLLFFSAFFSLKRTFAFGRWLCRRYSSLPPLPPFEQNENRLSHHHSTT
jgi:hypothetical protein